MVKISKSVRRHVRRLPSLRLGLLLGLLGGNALAANAAVNLTGQYTGDAQPTKGPVTALSVTFNQAGTTVTGTLSASGSACLSSLQFSGTVNGTTLSGSFTNAMSTIDISGTVSGDQVNGTYNIPVSPCAKGSGTFTLTKIASTATATPTPTATPVAPETLTPTSISSHCVGDCNGTGQVTVADILTIVNLVLGNGGSCPNGVTAGLVPNVSLILQAVNNALNGCPSP